MQEKMNLDDEDENESKSIFFFFNVFWLKLIYQFMIYKSRITSL
jgi:hypothetical protein